MNKFEQELTRYLGEKNLAKVQAVKIGIAGLGGLGSNCAMNLVRSGFKRFKIADFDKIEHSNLNRQFYFGDQIGQMKTEALAFNLKKINPDIEIEMYFGRIEKENVVSLFKECDIVVEAFDKAEYKSMLVEEMLPTGKLIVSASGLAGIGKSDDIRVHRVKDNLIIVGDQVSDARDNSPMSPRVNIAAAKQADVILEHVINS